MRKLLSALLIFCSLPVLAQNYRADLDFSNLEGGRSAGKYVVNLEISSNQEHALAQIAQSRRHDDGEPYCLTSATFAVGKVKLKITDQNHKINFSSEHPLNAYTSYETPGDHCISGDSLLANAEELYLEIGSMGIVLPVAAPKGFNDVLARLTVRSPQFAIVPGNIKNNMLDPKDIFVSLAKKSNLELIYTVVARRPDWKGELFLGHGIAELEPRRK
jgi:hypothetical protein